MLDNLDEKYMRFALALARRGGAKVHPNPKVGCVIVKDGEIVGRGYHEYFGGPHAEIHALADAGEKARGSTLYVTLEPCSHFGKTPPCTDAIIKAGITRVVIAMLDPNTNVRGQGMRKLKFRSVATKVGLFKQEALKLNQEYVMRRTTASPSVIVKAAMSADGKIATRTGDSKWISSKRSRSFVHVLRSKVDAIVVGRNTVVKDNPHLTSHGRGSNPVRIIIDPNLTSASTNNVFDSEAPTIVFHSNGHASEKLETFRRKGVLTVRMGRQGRLIDFRTIIATLRKFSLERILVEGGGETIAAALDSGLVTDLHLFIAPIIIGGRSALTPVEGPGVDSVRQALRLYNARVSKLGSDFLLSAKLKPR